MKLSQIVFCLALTAAITHQASANESLSEKGSSTAHDVKRSVKKGAHKTGEAFCAEGDVKCASKKASNRVSEGADYAKDKAHEVKDSVDSDSKARE